MSKGNLSSHLAKLEEGGLVAIEKKFVGKMPATNVTITRDGRQQIARHWKKLEELRQRALEWQPEG